MHMSLGRDFKNLQDTRNKPPQCNENNLKVENV